MRVYVCVCVSKRMWLMALYIRIGFFFFLKEIMTGRIFFLLIYLYIILLVEIEKTEQNRGCACHRIHEGIYLLKNWLATKEFCGSKFCHRDFIFLHF